MVEMADSYIDVLKFGGGCVKWLCEFSVNISLIPSKIIKSVGETLVANEDAVGKPIEMIADAMIFATPYVEGAAFIAGSTAAIGYAGTSLVTAATVAVLPAAALMGTAIAIDYLECKVEEYFKLAGDQHTVPAQEF